MGTSITFKRPDGKDAGGYLANAARGDAPGVVVIQEWWGLSEQIKGLCDRFAVAGFDALAPDLYKGKVVPYHDMDAAGKEMNSLDFIDATTQTVRGATQYLARNGAKVGLTGFCLGGAVTIIGAAKIPELTAGVVFYGIPPEQAAKPADIKIPLQAHFANKDDWCTPALVDGFEKAMKAAGKSLELFRYDAEHAFVNEQRQSVHDWPGAGRRSFSRSIWDDHIGSAATDVPAARTKGYRGDQPGAPPRLPDRLPVHELVISAAGSGSLVRQEICGMDLDASCMRRRRRARLHRAEG
jgi:carboxymethylenebutenolidase